MEQASNSVICLVHYFFFFSSPFVSGNKTWIFTTEKAVPEVQVTQLSYVFPYVKHSVSWAKFKMQ